MDSNQYNEQFNQFIKQFMKQYQSHTMKARYCQRCEEPRMNIDFQAGSPVCTHCLEAMRPDELRWLAKRYG